MADESTEIQVKIVGDAKAFRDSLKEASSDSNKFQKGLKDMKKAGIKVDKDVYKIAKDMRKFNKGLAQESIKHEQKLLGTMKQQQATLVKLSKAKKQNTEEFKKERTELAKNLKLYAQIRKERAEATGEDQPGLMSKVAGFGKRSLIAAAAAVVYGGIQRVGKANDVFSNFAKGGINVAGSNVKTLEEAKAFSSGGQKLGYDPEETMSQMAQISRLTGYASDVSDAQKFARGNMLEFGQAAGAFGLQSRGGMGGAAAKKDLEKVMASAVTTGLEDARFGEFLEGVQSLAEGAQSRSGGNVGASGAARALAMLGGNGNAGLTGSRGASVLSQLEQGFMGGGGEAGMALALRSAGWGRGTGFHEAKKKIQQGFTGEQGAENLRNYIRQVQSEYSGQASAEAVSAQTGVSFDIAEKVIAAVNKGGSTKNIDKQIAELTKKEASIEEKTFNIIKSDLAKEAIFQSGQQQMLVEQGADVRESIRKMQELINKAVSTIWPAIAVTLDIIANGVQDTADFLVDAASSDEDKAKRLVKHANEAVGTDSESFWMKRLETARKRASENLESANKYLSGAGTGDFQYESQVKAANEMAHKVVEALKYGPDGKGKSLEESADRSEQYKRLTDRITAARNLDNRDRGMASTSTGSNGPQTVFIANPWLVTKDGTPKGAPGTGALLSRQSSILQ